MERLTSRNEDCVLVNGHGLYLLMPHEIAKMAERLADYEDMDSKRIRPGDTVWLSQMFYTRPKSPCRSQWTQSALIGTARRTLPVAEDFLRTQSDGRCF